MLHLQCDLGSPRSGHLSAVAPEDIWLFLSKKFSLWTALLLHWPTCVEGDCSPVLLMSCILHRLWDGSVHPYSQRMPFFSLCLMNKMQTTFEKKKKWKSQAFYKNHKGCGNCVWLTLWELSNNHLCQTCRVSKLILTWQGSCWLAGGGFIFSPFSSRTF